MKYYNELFRKIDPFLRFKNHKFVDEENDQLELMDVKYVRPGVYKKTRLAKKKVSKNS